MTATLIQFFYLHPCLLLLSWAVTLLALIFSTLSFSFYAYSLAFHISLLTDFTFCLPHFPLPVCPTDLSAVVETAAQDFSEILPSMTDVIQKAVQFYPFNFENNPNEELYAMLGLLVDYKNPLRGIDVAYCRKLAALFCNCKCNCARGMMTVYFSSADNPKGATYASSVHNADSTRLLKYGYFTAINDGQHFFHALWSPKGNSGVG